MRNGADFLGGREQRVNDFSKEPAPGSKEGEERGGPCLQRFDALGGFGGFVHNSWIRGTKYLNIALDGVGMGMVLAHACLE